MDMFSDDMRRDPFPLFDAHAKRVAGAAGPAAVRSLDDL